jgi:hypothetical protein
MGQLDQETQVRHSDAYDDTVAAGAGMETPAAPNQNLLFDLNALRSQIRRENDPVGVDASTDDWFDSPLDNFGLRQVHDKKFVYLRPLDANNAFTLGAGAQGVLVPATLVAGGAGIIGVGPSSTQNNAYVAADEASFTTPGTLGVGLSAAVSGGAVVLNQVDIFLDGTNDPPLDGGTRVVGLLQVQNGVSDGTAIAGNPNENLQISFVKVDPATDVFVAVTLPAADYQFRLPYQQDFFTLDKGSLLGGALPDIIDPGSTVARLPFRHIDVTAGPALAGDPLNIQTGIFSTAGAQTVFASFGTPILPTTAAEFRDDERVKVFRNGNFQSKGTGKDVQWVSTTQLSFSKTVKSGDEIVIISPASF